jgi:hypothetical protein
MNPDRLADQEYPTLPHTACDEESVVEPSGRHNLREFEASAEDSCDTFTGFL